MLRNIADYVFVAVIHGIQRAAHDAKFILGLYLYRIHGKVTFCQRSRKGFDTVQSLGNGINTENNNQGYHDQGNNTDTKQFCQKLHDRLGQFSVRHSDNQYPSCSIHTGIIQIDLSVTAFITCLSTITG